MASQGHIKIDRRILNWEWYSDSNMVHVFLHLLLTANYSDSRFQGILIKRGQVLIGRLKLATALGLSERQIRTCLEKLKSTNEISIKTTNKFSIVTICKYDSYQSNSRQIDQQIDQQPDQQSTTDRPSIDQQPTTSKNNKEGRKRKYNAMDLVLPFSSKEFDDCWENWIEYKKSQYSFEYKALKTEQAALASLVKISGNVEKMAIEIIMQSIANCWQGLFPLKEVPAPMVNKFAHTPPTQSPSSFKNADEIAKKYEK